jgi:alpha-tubulin suppressor-like RCC1 family protein
MKNAALKLAAVLAVALALPFAACSGDDDKPDPGPIAVTDVTLDPATMELAVGGPGKSLTATVLPTNATDKSVTWKSEPTGIVNIAGAGATVTVNPATAGTTKITVATTDGNKTAECTVTVAPQVVVTSVTLAPTTLSLTLGGTNGVLTAAIEPANATNKNLTWSSLPTGVVNIAGTGATVTVSPAAAGTTTITVTTADNNKTAECAVTVIDPNATIPVTDVTLSQTTMSLAPGATGGLAATIEPSGATDQRVTWSSDSEAVATVTGNVGNAMAATVTAVAAGSATITVTTTDGNKTAICAVTVRQQPPKAFRATFAAGGEHTLAIKSDGALWAWGDNLYGQVGDGTTIQRNYPVPVDQTTDWVAVSCGWSHSVALKGDGGVWTWGWNYWGHLGHGDETDRRTPTRVGTDTDWAAVSAGHYYTAALKVDGSLWVWGRNTYGQLGLGDEDTRHVPVQMGTDYDWAAVSCNADTTVAIKVDGSLWAWGWNWYGEVGDGSFAQQNSPVPVGTDTDWAATTSGSNGHMLATKGNGDVWGWGYNWWGALGDGSADRYRGTPALVSADGDWESVSAGFEHSIIVKGDGSLWTCGSNAYGALGDGSDAGERRSPVKVGDDNDWAAADGHRHTVAGKTDGSVWTWGNNSYGALGDGTTAHRNYPLQVATGFRVPVN